MANTVAVQVTIYLNEADQWHHKPLHMEILNYLRQEQLMPRLRFTPWPDFSDGTKSRPAIWWMSEASCR